MRIGVIGGGAIGLLTAALLDSEKHLVTIYTRRKRQKEVLNEKRLLLQPDGKKAKIKAAHIDELHNEDLLIISVKQHQVNEIIPKVKQVSGALLFLQNGMGHIEVMESIGATRPVFAGVVEHGAIRPADHIVNQTGKGIIRVASFNHQAYYSEEIINSLVNGSFPISFQEDWYTMLINKLVVNTVVNPLTALFDVDNGELLTNSYLYSLAKQITKEISESLNLDEAQQWARVEFIIKNTASNMSSMRADIKQYRPTEVEGMAGYLVRNSKDCLPGVQFIYQAIKALEVKGSK